MEKSGRFDSRGGNNDVQVDGWKELGLDSRHFGPVRGPNLNSFRFLHNNGLPIFINRELFEQAQETIGGNISGPLPSKLIENCPSASCTHRGEDERFMGKQSGIKNVEGGEASTSKGMSKPSGFDCKADARERE